MRIKIPKFTWINVVDEDGTLLSQQCLQEEMIVITDDHNQEKKDSEKSLVYATMNEREETNG